jgi:DNA-binding SARP family transcriptional activator
LNTKSAQFQISLRKDTVPGKQQAKTPKQNPFSSYTVGVSKPFQKASFLTIIIETMTVLKLHLLGPFQATLAGQPLDHFETDKARALLAYLAVENAAPQRREFLASLLWPEFPDAAALRNLRLTLYRLRQTLEQAGGLARMPEAPGYLNFPDRQTIQFNPQAPAWIDVHEFETRLAACRRHPHPDLLHCQSCIEQMTSAVGFYQGDFLEGFSLKDAQGFDEWLLLQRERLNRQFLETLDQLANHYTWKAEHAGSLE